MFMVKSVDVSMTLSISESEGEGERVVAVRTTIVFSIDADESEGVFLIIDAYGEVVATRDFRMRVRRGGMTD